MCLALVVPAVIPEWHLRVTPAFVTCLLFNRGSALLVSNSCALAVLKQSWDTSHCACSAVVLIEA